MPGPSGGGAPAVPVARLCWAAGLLRPAYGKWEGLVPPELASPTWERPLFSSTWLQCQRESGKGLLFIYLFVLNKDVAGERQLASLGLLRLSVYFPGQEQMKSQKYHFRLLPNDTVQIKMWS